MSLYPLYIFSLQNSSILTIFRSQDFKDILDVVSALTSDPGSNQKRQYGPSGEDWMWSTDKEKNKPQVDFNVIGKVHVNKISNPRQLTLIRYEIAVFVSSRLPQACQIILF